VKRVIKAVVTLLCIAALAIVVLVIVVPALLGMQRYVITGGSMTGTISKGSVIYSRLTPVEQLKVGDIITFYPPGYSAPVTHRIIGIDAGQDGKLVFRTKGDFNEVADPWKATLVEPRQARYVFHIPAIGYVLAALAIRPVRMILIGLPALVIAVSLLWSLWKKAGDEVERQASGEGAGGAGSRV
jgi:signal peptidase I, archaeal type